MSSFEQQFNSSLLEVVVPDASVEFPTAGSNGDAWYSQLKREAGERNTAFFDEQLEFILVLRTPGPTDIEEDETPRPSADLLSFFAHIQVALEASYIQAGPAPGASGAPGSAQLGLPPRSASLKPGGSKHRPPNLHPSIFPPQTPHPTPSAVGGDRQYVRSEGTPLISKTWGEEDGDDFSLLWSKTDRVWLALFKMNVGVAFLRLDYLDPLLCLTVSTTLRDRSLQVNQGRRTLQRLLDAAGGVPESAPPTPIKTEQKGADEDAITGLEEVNLFEGLHTGPTFQRDGDNDVSLPSSRLGVTTRRQEFSLTTFTTLPDSLPSAAPKTNQILRKAFRKTLSTASGFRVRMRTVFVPYVLLPSSSSGATNGEGDGEDDAPAAGMAESTVMLCVELENLGEAGGFAVEDVVVDVSGDGARATLIGWDPTKKTPEQLFPVRLGPYEQHNLLYAVSFVRSADADDSAPADLQRAVAIYVHGRPYELASKSDANADSTVHYPSKQFSSRWNCVLDLDPRRNRLSQDYYGGQYGDGKEVLPEPATPFPAAESPQTATLGSFAQAQTQSRPSSPAIAAVAGSKRHTLAAISTSGSRPLANAPATAGGGGGGGGGAAPVNYRSSTSMLNPAFQAEREREALIAGGGPRRGPSPIPPSLALQQNVQARTPTTYSFPGGGAQSMSSPAIQIGSDGSGDGPGQFASLPMPPPTPAYPAYPAAPQTPTPYNQTPLANSQAGVGPSVEIRRDRGAAQGMQGMLVPPTPGPRVPASFGSEAAGHINMSAANMMLTQPNMGMGMHEGGVTMSPMGDENDKLVVSIGLLPPIKQRKTKATSSDDSDGDSDEDERSIDTGPRRIYPLERFTLDIFVFNQSGWTRRLELSYPNARQRRKDRDRPISGYFPPVQQDGTNSGKADIPGIMALENRVRIGPLRPATCQSVRLQFMAMKPGVHPVETLTLTDVETGYSVNLRSIMDVVVHDRM